MQDDNDCVNFKKQYLAIGYNQTRKIKFVDEHNVSMLLIRVPVLS